MQQYKLGYPYDYGDELTSEMAQSNRIKMLTISILIWVLIRSQVEAAPLPGADGFPVRPNPPRGRLNRNKCRNYGIISKLATSAGN